MKAFQIWVRILISTVVVLMLFLGCTSPEVSKRLDGLQARQDSILTLLAGMQEKHEFMAMRMGWRPPPDTTTKEIPIGQSFSQGAANPILTLVEFTDLECPYCAQVAPILDSLVKAYPNDVRVVFKNFPLGSIHPNARAAAAAAIAAGKQGKFFEFRYAIAPSFRSLGDSLYLSIAGNLGLDLEKFNRDRALTPEMEKLLDDDMVLGRKVGVEGTPTVFRNGKLASDRSFGYFAALLKSLKG